MIGDFCTAAATTDRFATRLLADTDCQAYGLVERGYAALSQPGSTISIALTGLLVIAVALFGYRLLLGRGIILRDAMDLTIKIGVVLLIATSWESWQALAYHGLARAPSEVARDMLVAIGAPSPLDSLQKTLDSLTAAGVGYRTRAGIASPLVGGPAAAAAVLNIAAVLLTLATVGILVAARVVLAVLLAIAPAMAGFLLFDSTRGIAQNWLGAMAAAAIAPLFVLLIAAIEFAILGPMIERLLAEQAAGTFENSAVMPIGLVTIVFGIAMIAGVRAGARISRGIRLKRGSAAPSIQVDATTSPASERERNLLIAEAQARPRVAVALENIARRDAPPPSTRIRSVGSPGASSAARDSGGARSSANDSAPMFASSARRSRMKPAPRRSRAAARRDA